MGRPESGREVNAPEAWVICVSIIVGAALLVLGGLFVLSLFASRDE